MSLKCYISYIWTVPLTPLYKLEMFDRPADWSWYKQMTEMHDYCWNELTRQGLFWGFFLLTCNCETSDLQPYVNVSVRVLFPIVSKQTVNILFSFVEGGDSRWFSVVIRGTVPSIPGSGRKEIAVQITFTVSEWGF